MSRTATILRDAFPKECIANRPDGYDYIEAYDIINRLLDATAGTFDVTIERGPELVSDGNKTFWLCAVTISIEGLGKRTGVGTHQPQGKGAEDSPKAAFTDALKRAAVLFGVGLQLYENEAAAMRRKKKATEDPLLARKVQALKDWKENCTEEALTRLLGRKMDAPYVAPDGTKVSSFNATFKNLTQAELEKVEGFIVGKVELPGEDPVVKV